MKENYIQFIVRGRGIEKGKRKERGFFRKLKTIKDDGQGARINLFEENVSKEEIEKALNAIYKSYTINNYIIREIEVDDNFETYTPFDDIVINV